MIRDMRGWLLTACAIAWSAQALAHDSHVTFATLTLAERAVSLELRVAGTDLEEVTGRTLTIRGGIVNPHWLKDAEADVLAYVRSRLVVRERTGPTCVANAWVLREDFQSVVVGTRWTCNGAAGGLAYANHLLFERAAATKHFTRIGTDPKTQPIVLNDGARELTLTGPPPPLGEVLARYTLSGTEHIFIGIDHIAFLIALLLWARSLIALIKIVTAFTLAHSVTLSLAALDVVTLPSALVEPAIAATIVYVAAENFFRHGISGKWRGAFLLGLVHGFGFASVLKETGFPQGALGWALASFNVGVEIGQVVIVAAVFPLLLLLDRLTAQRERVVYAASAVIMGLGIFWLVERVWAV